MNKQSLGLNEMTDEQDFGSVYLQDTTLSVVPKNL